MSPKVALALLAAATLCACQTQKSWVYAPESRATAASHIPGKAVVLPFDDMRVNENKNYIAMYMIPVLPGFGWMDLNVPEGSQMHVNSALWTNYKPTEDFAKALASELDSSGLFQEAHFDFGRRDANFVIRGKIVSTHYSGKIIAYGLSLYGPLLWFLGLPAGTVNNELSVELSCVDARTNRAIFTKAYSAEPYSRMSFLYSLPDDFNYPAMLKSVYAEFLADLRRRDVQAKFVASAAPTR